jgi:uncharacterized protein YqgC (DUF456 family)
MDVAIWLVVGALMLLGLVGTFVPFLPGTPLIFLGALVHGFATGWRSIGPGRLAILGSLAVLAYLLHYAAGALGARQVGGSAWAVVGALIGGVVGMFFGIPGLLLGPPIGAIVGELVKTGEVRASVRSGLAAFVGMVAGAIANFAIALVMIALFIWWVAGA